MKPVRQIPEGLNVVCVSPGTTVRQIAPLMSEKHVSALPVVDDGKIVGIVSRSDIVQALARRPQSALEPTDADDDAVRFKPTETLSDILVASPWLTTVTVSHGIVELGGGIEDECAETIPCCYQTDTLGHRRERPSLHSITVLTIGSTSSHCHIGAEGEPGVVNRTSRL